MLTLSASAEGQIIDTARPIIVSAAEVGEAHEIAAHQHPRGQLLYAEQGVMQVSVGRTTWRVTPRMGLWVPPAVPHRVTAGAGISYRSLFVNPDQARGLPRCGMALDIPALTRALICEAATFGADYQPQSAEARLIAVLQDRLSSLSAAKLSLPLPQDARARRVCEALLDSPAENRSLAAWGHGVGASSRTLARLFLHETGLSFGVWVQRLRLSLALERLTRGESVTHLALELGYATPSAFSAMFRRVLGSSPRRYLSVSRQHLS
jgi:AraC-like DNA-binding protein